MLYNKFSIFIFNHCQTLSIIYLLSLSSYINRPWHENSLLFLFFNSFSFFNYILIHWLIVGGFIFFIEIEFFFLIMFWKLSLNFHLIKSFCLNKKFCSPDFVFYLSVRIFFNLDVCISDVLFLYILEIHRKKLGNKLLFYLKVQIQTIFARL